MVTLYRRDQAKNHFGQTVLLNKNRMIFAILLFMDGSLFGIIKNDGQTILFKNSLSFLFLHQTIRLFMIKYIS